MSALAGPNQNTVAGQTAAVRQQLQAIDKKHTAAVNGVQQQVNALGQSFTTNALTVNGNVSLPGARQVTVNGKQLYGWSGDGAYPVGTGSSTFGGGAGVDLGTGDFNATAITDLEALQTLINNVAGLANFIYSVLVNAGILAS